MATDALLDAVRLQADRVSELVNRLPAEMWERGDVAQWGPPQHLAHLTRSHERTAQGFALRERLPQHEAGTSRSYAEVKSAYLSALATVPSSALQPNPIPPEVPQNWTREEALAAFQVSLETLATSVTPWSDAELDARALPHPLLGLISGRELLHFTAYHAEHHRAGIKRSARG